MKSVDGRIRAGALASCLMVGGCAEKPRDVWVEPPPNSYSRAQMHVAATDGTTAVHAAVVTPGFFTAIGVAPRIGRLFVEGDWSARQVLVAIISHDFWTGRFGSDQAAIGRSIVVNGRQVVVVGIMPQGFAIPGNTDLWLPVQPEAAAVEKPAATDEQTELQRLESLWNRAQRDGDATALERLLAEDVVITVPAMAPMNKASALSALRTASMKFDRYETDDVQIRQNGTVAIVTGRLQRVRKAGDQEVTDDWRFTKAYAQRGGRWLVVAWHASPSPPTK